MAIDAMSGGIVEYFQALIGQFICILLLTTVCPLEIRWTLPDALRSFHSSFSFFLCIIRNCKAIGTQQSFV